MAASNEESNKENVADGETEQIVTMEKVVAADNKGIDYDKLISEFTFSYRFTLYCHIFFDSFIFLSDIFQAYKRRANFHRSMISWILNHVTYVNVIILSSWLKNIRSVLVEREEKKLLMVNKDQYDILPFIMHNNSQTRPKVGLPRHYSYSRIIVPANEVLILYIVKNHFRDIL